MHPSSKHLRHAKMPIDIYIALDEIYIPSSHLHDDVGILPYLLGFHDSRARGLVLGIREVRHRPGAPLDQNAESGFRQLRHGLVGTNVFFATTTTTTTTTEGAVLRRAKRAHIHI